MHPAAMLVIVLLMAVVIGWWRDHRVLITSLKEKAEETAHYKQTLQEAQARTQVFLPDFGRADSVTFADQLLQSGAEMSAQLSGVVLAGPQFSDADVVSLVQECRTIQEIELSGGNFSAASIRALSRLSKLKTVQLNGDWLTDESLVAFGELKSVREIVIGDGQISDAGLAGLALQRPDLDVLGVHSSAITDEGFAALHQLTNLVSLRLDESGITDDGVKALKTLSDLRFLSLRRTNVSDASLITLQELKALRHLLLSGTKVSRAGVASLQKELPKCQITLGDPNVY